MDSKKKSHNKKYYYDVCKCGKKKENKKRSYCKECSRQYYYKNKNIVEERKQVPNSEIVEFVKIIELRNGYVSLEEYA